MLSFSRSQAPPNLYPQLPPGQQPPFYPSQHNSGAMQPYGFNANPNLAGPSQPMQLYQPPSQPQPGNMNAQVQPFSYGFNSAYQPAAPSSQLQPYNQQPQQQQQVQQQQGQQPSGSNQLQQGYRPPYTAGQPSASISLTPQPLESVSKDEDPVYGPLGRARGKVERAMRADEEISPDLADMLSMQTNEPYTSLPSSSHAFRPLRMGKTIPLPDALHQELNYKHLTAKMGLFEEIERAWFTVDNKLFLWDYTDGRDFSRYDEQAETIQAVGLVKARKDVFVDDITHVLVICTSSKATLLGLSRTSPREINLYATQLSVDTPTSMLSISGTTAGRIFMLGSNKDLYELEYASESGWFFGSSTRVYLHNRTSGTLSNWVPSILSSSAKEGVESFTVDPLQNRLYTLQTKGEIEMFDVSGNGWISRGRYTRLKSDLISRGLAGQGPGYKGAEVVLIAPVGGEESRRACMVAVCANGTRVYFSYSFAFQPLMFRPPPFNSLNLSQQSFYSSGTFLGVSHDTNSPTPSTSLTTIVPNIGRQSVARENYDNFDSPIYQEYATQDTVPSQVWTIVELPSTCPATAPYTQRKGDGIVLNPLLRQCIAEGRQFLILATSGLFMASMPRPVDMLNGEIEQEKDTAITIARNTFGRIQTAAMGILLGSSSEPRSSDLSSAISSILLSSGSPLIRDTTAGKTITYSARHDALALILSRYLRPIWSSRITAPAGPGRQILGVPQKTLLEVQTKLEGLRGYIEEFPFPRSHAEGDTKVAWDQEELSLHGLGVLVRQTIEAISFVLLLADYKIGEIVAKCDPGLQSTLANLTYQGLLTTTDGRDIARKLVTALIEQQIGQELGIDTLSELLQQRCGSFCQPGDVVLYKAEESMRRAESSRDPAERDDHLNESLRLFSKAAGNVQIPRLQDVTKRYRALDFTVGSIELPLRCAADLDPNDRATDYVRDGEHPSDPRKALYNARMECYACVIEALGLFDEALNKATAAGNPGATIQKRDEAYGLAIASDDELFHFYLYDWHVARHLSEQFLEFDTPYIEKYLQITSSGVEERRDLLWKYYARREEYLAASKALFELATRNNALPLNDRAYYLAQSLTSAKSASSVGSDDVEFVSSLQERIDVAQVQMEVARAIESHSDLTREEKSEALGRLDRELIGLDELYQAFARPYRLYEPILLILKTADTRIDDVCEAVWRQLIQSASASSGSDGVGRDARIGETVKELMRRYFPSEAAPLDIVLPVIYAEAGAIRGTVGWASEALLDGGVPLRDLWEAVMSLYEESDDQQYFTEEAGVLAQRWTLAKEQIPAAEVERFASAYLLRTNAGDEDERVRVTRDRMSAAKAAAGRY